MILTLSGGSTAGRHQRGVARFLLPRKKRTGNNSRQATGFDWKIPSPPLTANFIKTPVVDHEAYDCEWLGHKREQEVVTVG